MGIKITLFMWGYQPHFQYQLQRRANLVLQSIAPIVQAKALLVGIRTPEKTDGYPVCVEPEDEDWDPKIFFDCATRSDSIFSTHPDHSLFFGDAPSMRDKPENIRKKSVREAVKEVTSAYDLQHGTITFCGWPNRVEGYYVVPILQFNRAHLFEYPHLAEPMRFQDWKSSTGLLESVIECLLKEATNDLGEKEPGRFFNFCRDTTAILREAGDRFCGAISLGIGDPLLQDTFEVLNVISSLPYEGAEAIGGLLFAPKDSKTVDILVRLNEPVPLHEYKLARKVIEMSGRDLLCVCHGASGINGLGTLDVTDADSVFRVYFSGHYKWDLYYKDRLLMKTAFGIPRLPSVRLNEQVVLSNIRRIFPEINGETARRLWSIIDAAMEQRHGTMIVISAAAEEEAKRLSKQSLGIEPITLTADLVRCISGIDGAILINPEGTCPAIGVILDGMATNEGDPSRGARYNSAIRYIATSKSRTLCLVVSGDGYVNVLPNLLPQIAKLEIDNHISRLKTQTIDNYHKTINWLDDHRFYLTTQQCDIVNRELTRIRSVPINVGEIRIDIKPFMPHPAMNDSYYLPDQGQEKVDVSHQN